MYPGHVAQKRPDRPANVMAATGESPSYAELEAQANRGARLCRSLGLAAGDTVAVWLKNCRDYFEIYWAAQRAGLYLCPVATHLTAEEAAYILNDSGSRLLVTHAGVEAAAALVRDRKSTRLNSSH